MLRSQPGYAAWGPASVTPLGTGSFPSGSTFFVQRASRPASLEIMLASLTGTPCVVGQRANADGTGLRGGQVLPGYQVKPSTALTARLNLVAANALFTQLGIPSIVPE